MSTSPDQLLLDSFRSWLSRRSLSPSTIKNYVSDVNIYFQTLNSQNPFSYQSLKDYLQEINGLSNYPRYLASLSLFCQFGIDQHLIQKNPILALKKEASSSNIPTLEALINEYSNYLAKKNTPSSTIKNYISDLTQYLRWLQSNIPTVDAP